MLPPPMIAILAMAQNPTDRAREGTSASCRVCTMMRPVLSTTVWSSSNQS